MTSTDEVWQPSPNVAQVDGQRIALINVARLADPALVLEGTAAEIWRLLDGFRDLAEAAATLEAMLNLRSGTTQDAVQSFVDQLAAAELLVKVNGD